MNGVIREMAEGDSTLSMAIVALMLQRGFNMAGIARMLQIDKGEVRKIADGGRELKANQLLIIARKMQIDLPALLAAAMAPYGEPQLAGGRLAKLLRDVSDEVSAIWQRADAKRRQQSQGALRT